MGTSDHDAWVAQTFGTHPSASIAAQPAAKAGPAEEVAKPAPPRKPVDASSLLDPNNPARKAALEKMVEEDARRKQLTTPGPARAKTGGDDKGQSPADAARGPGPHIGDDNPLGEGGIDIPVGPATVRPSTDGSSVGGVTVTIPFGGKR